MGTLVDIGEKAYDTAVANGYTNATDIERIALCHSELSEALEFLREEKYNAWFEVDGKPEGLVVELADTVIRICELVYRLGLDLDDWIEAKQAYNMIRKDVPARDGVKTK